MKLQLFAIGVLALAAACAPTAKTAANAASPAGRDCFNASFLSGFSNVDHDTVRVSAGPSQEYDLDLLGPSCRDIQWTTDIAVVTRPSNWVCVGKNAGLGDVKFRDSATGRTTSCTITEVRRYVKPAPAAGS